jgi:hypothetical protein
MTDMSGSVVLGNHALPLVHKSGESWRKKLFSLALVQVS